MSQHPYSASVPASEQLDLQQSLFPSWHNRRHSHSTDMILEGGQRKSGSFEALKDMMQKHQSQKDDPDDDEQPKDKMRVAANNDNKSTPVPPGPSILIQEPNQKETTAADSNEKKKQPKIRRSVKFNAEEDNGSNFIKN
ncbi:RNA polymerase II holoenzyme cyclin-like subunit [Mucor velutinosus]|uniref:RNA polymerase II holoenzyme cyclin-like subunit n=1 Tax=Mucor velutinosus TaxID=708070 RepID=A0AAN7DS44_9FUNG|nr:RNA polymerase II holoenzyme cyclin-like subunit [Mucor velutinosus]